MTSVQNGVEPRACYEGASVDPTDARNARLMNVGQVGADRAGFHSTRSGRRRTGCWHRARTKRCRGCRPSRASLARPRRRAGSGLGWPVSARGSAAPPGGPTHPRFRSVPTPLSGQIERGPRESPPGSPGSLAVAVRGTPSGHFGTRSTIRRRGPPAPPTRQAQEGRPKATACNTPPRTSPHTIHRHCRACRIGPTRSAGGGRPRAVQMKPSPAAEGLLDSDSATSSRGVRIFSVV